MITLEIGKSKKANHDIIVKFSEQIKYSQKALHLEVNSIIRLDKKAGECGSTNVDIFVDGYLEAKGLIGIFDKNWGVKIDEIIAEANNILNFEIGNVIKLDRQFPEPFDVLINDNLVAKGVIVVIEKSLNILIVEIVSDNN